MKLDEFVGYLVYVSAVSSALPFYFSITNRVFSSGLKTLFVYIFFSLIFELISLIIIDNFFFRDKFQYLFTLLEITLISVIYFEHFSKKYLKQIIKLFYILFLVAYIICFFNTVDFYSIDRYFNPIEHALFISYSILYMYEINLVSKFSDIIFNHFFWINTAFLINFGTNFIFFLLIPYIDTSNKLNIHLLGIFHLIVNILYNVILVTGICKIKKV